MDGIDADGPTVRMGPAGIARREQRTEGLTAENIKAMFSKYFSTAVTLVTLGPNRHSG